MQPNETPLFELHKTNSFVKLYPSGIEVANTSESITYIPLSHVELRALADEISKNMEAALTARAIETAFSMRDEDDRFTVLRELGSVQEVAAKYESFNTLHIEKLSDFDRAVVLAVGMAYRDVLQSYTSDTE